MQISDDFPNEKVKEAYLSADVNASKVMPQWGSIKKAEIERFHFANNL